MERFSELRETSMRSRMPDGTIVLDEKTFNSADAPTSIDKVREWLSNPQAFIDFISDKKEMERMYTKELSYISGRTDVKKKALIHYACKKTIKDYEECPDEVTLYRVDWKCTEDFGTLPKGALPKESLSCHWSNSMTGVMRYLSGETLFKGGYWKELREPVKVTTCTTSKDNINWVAEVFYVVCGYAYERERRIIDNSKLNGIETKDYKVKDFKALYSRYMNKLYASLENDPFENAKEFITMLDRGVNVHTTSEAYWNYMIDNGIMVKTGEDEYEKVKDEEIENIDSVFNYMYFMREHYGRNIRITCWKGDIDTCSAYDEFLPYRIEGDLTLTRTSYGLFNFKHPVEVTGDCRVDLSAMDFGITNPENLHVHGDLTIRGSEQVYRHIEDVRKVQVDGTNEAVEIYDEYGDKLLDFF